MSLVCRPKEVAEWEEKVALTVLLLVIELSLREVHVKGNDERAADVDVVKVWKAFSLLPHSGAGPGDLVSQNVDLLTEDETQSTSLVFYSLNTRRHWSHTCCRVAIG